MKKQMILRIGDVEGVVDMFEDKAPKTCAAVWNALPFHDTLNHANFSGEEVSFPTPGVMWEKENQLYDCEPGDFGYFYQGPAICIYYGPLRVISPGNVFARITGNLKPLQEIARRTWRNPAFPSPSAGRKAEMTDKNSLLGQLVAKIEAATASLHTGKAQDPANVKQLRGCMGQSFTTTVFAFQQATVCKDGITFIGALIEKFPQEKLIPSIAAEQFKRPVNTLKTRYALKDTAALHEEAAKISASLSHAELLTLVRAFTVYYAYLMRRIRDQLPFYELSIAFEGQKLVAERVALSPMGKGVD